MESGFPPQSYRGALRRLRRGLWIVACVSAVISILMLTGAIYMLQIYDRVLNSGSVPTLLVLFGLVVVLYGFLAVYDGLRMRLLSRMALGLDAELAAAAFRSDLRMSERGQRAQCSADLEVLRGTLAGPAMLALFDLPFTFVFVAVLFAIHPVLGLLTVLGMGLAGVLAFLNRMVLASPIAEAEQIESRQRQLEEAVRAAAPSLGALGMREALCTHWLNAQRARLAVAQRGQDPSTTLAAISRAFRMLLQAILLTAAALLVLQGTITAGAIIAASILSGRAIAPVDQLIGQWRYLLGARTAHERLKQAIPGHPPERLNLPPITGALSLDRVTRIPPETKIKDPLPILKAISFDLQPGAGLGIIGASASGKSTLAQLIVGALEPDSGHVRIDGATLSQWGDDLLGRQIGYLPQRIDLLPGTVRDNICRFDQTATDAAVLDAAKSAGVHDLILRLPDGYDTVLGGTQMPLSGGQIQRIGLARALYGNPMLLVLDEPNAHLDRAGEMALTAALKARRAAGATVIVLAHRIGALAALDRLILLDDGEIRQDGPRDEVITKLGLHAPKRSPLAPPRISIRPLARKDDSAPFAPAPDAPLAAQDAGNARPSISPSTRQQPR